MRHCFLNTSTAAFFRNDKNVGIPWLIRISEDLPVVFLEGTQSGRTGVIRLLKLIRILSKEQAYRHPATSFVAFNRMPDHRSNGPNVILIFSLSLYCMCFHFALSPFCRLLIIPTKGLFIFSRWGIKQIESGTVLYKSLHISIMSVLFWQWNEQRQELYEAKAFSCNGATAKTI